MTKIQTYYLYAPGTFPVS